MRKEKKNLVINLIKLILTFLIFWVIFKRVPFNSLFEVINGTRFFYFIPVFLLGVGFTILKIYKWHLLLSSVEDVNFSRSVDSYFIGMSLGIVTPGRIGEIGRISNINKKLEGLGIALWDKIFDLYIVLLLALPGVYYFRGFLVAILYTFFLIAIFFILIRPQYLDFLKKIPILKNYPQIIDGLKVIKLRTLIINLIITFMAYFLVIIEGYFLGMAFNMENFFAFLYGYPLVMLVNLIPITIAGLGIREGTAILILDKFSVPSNIAFNVSFLIFLINTALPAILGVFAMYLEEIKKSIYKTDLWAYLITFIGGFLRFYKIGVRSIWIDEAITAQVSVMGVKDIILNRASTGIHPPLYFILMHFWIKIFGDSEIAIRSLSAIFGILCIFMIYKLASKIFDKLTGLISAFIFAFSPFYVYFGQEARMYPMVTFLILLSLYYLLKGIDKGKNITLITISNILMLYTHIFSAFVVLSENLFVFITNFKNKKVLKKWIIAQFIILLFILPWLYVIIQNRTPEVYQGAQKVSLTNLGYTFLEINLGAGRAVFRNKILIASLFLLIFIIGFLPPWEKKREILLLFLYLFVPILLLLLLSLRKSFFSARYISMFIPGYVIFLGRGIRRFKHYSLIFLIVMGLLSIYALGLNYYYSNLANLNRPWRDAVRYIHENVGGEKVFIFAPYMWRPFEYYNRGKISYETLHISQLESKLKGLSSGERFWMIIANHEIEDPEGKVISLLENKFIPLKEVRYYRIIIKQYKVPEG
ncbi:MAG: flippase-like domain-containing protein [Dictyoglomus thermophilum]|uniref:Flippase-like domain-containing protein n=1 Tax=Dictyoglomus thermophilum TaxID=14 RepID=A0A7V4DXQ6_DICTH|nr:flippase-like domain-containing protein [Dictyoglomus thermophilum]MCX7720300.1 flippase-like domain-containing protein [Dictyoglomus thermophilum]TYT23241.1 flippase-like domain-containing protein [Dictyoglomus thermophilum]